MYLLQEQQGISCLPTASGKSLVTAILSKKVEKYGRSIIIVPNKDLITQTEIYYKILGMDSVYIIANQKIFSKHTRFVLGKVLKNFASQLLILVMVNQ